MGFSHTGGGGERGIRTEGLKDTQETINLSERGIFLLAMTWLPFMYLFVWIKNHKLQVIIPHILSINKIIKSAWGLGLS